MNRRSDLWKRTERAIAARLGGQRTGNRGVAAPDVTTPWAAVEVKERRRLPQWIVRAVAQARAGAGPNRLPLVILHEAGAKHDGDIVCLSLADFEAWYGKP
jgi:hypothetical protein